jgi:phenylpropionate dioxygenase-like ring-hydroxylating dioxygenase large terminal subunit
VEFSDEIQVEDVGICEIVQKNLHSRSYKAGRYSVQQEKGVYAFHQMYRELMAGLTARLRDRDPLLRSADERRIPINVNSAKR